MGRRRRRRRLVHLRTFIAKNGCGGGREEVRKKGLEKMTT